MAAMAAAQEGQMGDESAIMDGDQQYGGQQYPWTELNWIAPKIFLRNDFVFSHARMQIFCGGKFLNTAPSIYGLVCGLFNVLFHLFEKENGGGYSFQ